ncbi:MAG: endonuclease-3 [bacterium]
MSPEKISSLFKILHTSNPNPETELNFQNTFELLISVILSAQATDISVNKVTPALFAIAPTPESMVNLGVDEIKKKIKSIGLYNSKAKNIYLCCKSLVENFKSQVPRTRKELESLAGVGRKTAGVVLNEAFGEKTIAVDTHVFRVSNRLGLVKAKTEIETEKELMKVVPDFVLQDAHHLLILHGRYICKARKPVCSQCHLTEYCEYPDKIIDV